MFCFKILIVIQNLQETPHHSVMFLALFLASCFSLNEFLTTLSYQARRNAKHPRASFFGQTEYSPGDYDLGGVSFSLSSPLIGGYTPSVSGYAFSHSVLAIISPPLIPGTVFVDAENESLLQVKNYFLSEGEVIFYNVTLQNPLDVFKNLKMRTFSVGSGYNSLASLGSATAQYHAVAKYRWNETADRPIPLGIGNSLHFLLGAFLNATASAQVTFNGFQNINLDYFFKIEGRLGVGIWINQSLISQFPQQDPFNVPIVDWSSSLLGFTLNLSVKGYVSVSIREIEVQLPKSIEYYRVFQAIVQNQGSLSTKTGFTKSPMVFELTTNAPQSLDLDELFDFIFGLKLFVKPELDFGIKLNIVVGSAVNHEIQLGALIDSVWTFSLNTESCLCPYLYGQTVTDMKMYVKSQDFKLFGYKLLNGFNLEMPLFSGFETPKGCIFSSRKAKEGVPWLRFDVTVPSYIISGFIFTASTLDLGLSDFRPSIQALESTHGRIFQDLQLPPIHWNVSRGGIQTADRPGWMVVKVPTNGNIRWHASEAIFWFPWSETATLNLTTGHHITSIGNVSNVEYDVVQAQDVEILKEFPGTNNSYISFKPNIPPGSLLGAIVHSVTGEESYTTARLEQVFDDSGFDLNTKEFLGENQVEIEIISFCPKRASTAQLTFKRNSTELKVALANDLSSGVSVSNPFDISQVMVDLNNQDPLTIEILLAQSRNKFTSETVTISQEELSNGTNFTLQRSSENFNLTLSVVRTQPNVVFQFTQPLTETQRAIICRITQSFSSAFEVILQPTEYYGIIRFQSVSVPTSESVIGLVSMPGLTPLCDHRQLDSDHFVIPLIMNQTIFESNIQIPFRRASVGVFNTTVGLNGIFATTADGLCGSGVSITTGSATSVACLENCVNNGTDTAGWTAIFQSVGKSPVTISGVDWRLHTFQVPAGKIDLLPSIFTMPEDSVFLQLPGSAIQPFAAVGLAIFVRCYRAQRIELTCGIPSTAHLVERGEDGLFQVHPCVNTDLLITAVCNDSEAAFCQFTMTLEKRTLLKYDSAGGVFEINNNNTTPLPGALLPGISRQIVGPRGPVQAYKSWNGSIKQVAVIKNAANLTVKAKVMNGVKVELSLMFGDLSVPFSAEKYYNDPEQFYTALGIAKPWDGYHAEIVNFTDSADVETATSAINLEVLEGWMDFELTTDLPKELVVGQEFVLEEHNNKPTNEPMNIQTNEPTMEETSLSGGSIARIDIGCMVPVVIVVIVLICYCCEEGEYENGKIDPQFKVFSLNSRDIGGKKKSPDPPGRSHSIVNHFLH
jgi:hypothetical protein